MSKNFERTRTKNKNDVYFIDGSNVPKHLHAIKCTRENF